MLYIHHVVDRLKMGAAPANTATVEAIIAAAISDPHDAWDLFHFQSVGEKTLLVMLENLDEVFAGLAMRDKSAGRRFAERAAQIIAGRRDTSSLVIGLNAPWGKGHTAATPKCSTT